jgi:hypothetical protein
MSEDNPKFTLEALEDIKKRVEESGEIVGPKYWILSRKQILDAGWDPDNLPPYIRIQAEYLS